jgi:hypothetical protein
VEMAINLSKSSPSLTTTALEPKADVSKPSRHPDFAWSAGGWKPRRPYRKPGNHPESSTEQTMRRGLQLFFFLELDA